MKHSILLLEDIAEDALGLMGNVKVFRPGSAYDPSAISGIIARGKEHVTKEMMDEMPMLKVISRCGVGVNNVDVAYATTKGIQVINTPGVNADSVAEHTLSLILMLQRKMYEWVAEVKKGNWQRRNEYDGDEIRSKVLGIVGMGNIGMKVARLAECFGMKVQYWNRNEKDAPFEYKSLDVLLSSSDIISLHIPLTDETHHFIDSGMLGTVKRGAFLVNTARGGVVDEEALIEALSVGQVGGYAADIPDIVSQASTYALLQFPNVLITPHTSSLTKRTFDEICSLAVLNAIALLNGDHIAKRFKVNRV